MQLSQACSIICFHLMPQLLCVDNFHLWYLLIECHCKLSKFILTRFGHDQHIHLVLLFLVFYCVSSVWFIHLQDYRSFNFRCFRWTVSHCVLHYSFTFSFSGQDLSTHLHYLVFSVVLVLVLWRFFLIHSLAHKKSLALLVKFPSATVTGEDII